MFIFYFILLTDEGIYDRVDAGTPPFPSNQQQSVSQAQHSAQMTDGPAPFPVSANQSGELDDMLGNLNTDLSKQGIMNVPKGHCAACAKPIVGQVRVVAIISSTLDVHRSTAI